MIFSQGHALLVGVGGDLPNTADDADALALILRDPERCAYSDRQVDVLTQGRARREDVLGALEALAGRADEKSTAIVYFSGHGYFVTTNGTRDYFLLPYGYDLADLPDTAIRDHEFADALGRIRAQKLLVLLDCCHAAGIERTKAPGQILEKASIPPEAEAMLKGGGGRVAIASSRANEVSYTGDPYSAFTQALIEGLTGSAASEQDGYVRVADLAMYAGSRVQQSTGQRQHPVLRFSKADNFPVSYYAGGHIVPKAPPLPPPPPRPQPEAPARRAFIVNENIVTRNLYQAETMYGVGGAAADKRARRKKKDRK